MGRLKIIDKVIPKLISKFSEGLQACIGEGVLYVSVCI